MSSDADTATLARQWVETHIALFVVIVVSAVLLVVTIIAVLAYCCCCRKKRRGSWSGGGGGVKSSGGDSSYAQGDSVDASSAVTATARGPNVVEIKVENEYHNQQQQGLDYQATIGSPGIELSQKESASVEDVRLQQSSQAELRAEFPNLPHLPKGVEVTKEAELRLHDKPLQEVQANLTAAAYASAAASASGSIGVSADVEPAKLDDTLRLPRTEVVMQSEIEPQRQQPLRSSPKKAAAPAPSVVIVPPKTEPQRRIHDDRPSHEHRHGSSIYQSDDNEITIVDSDFSDYEDTPEDEYRKRERKIKSRIGAALDASIDIDAGGEADFGWETLPNQSVTVDEAPVVAVDRQGVEYIPAPSPSLEEQQMRRVDNLAELDRTLEVFQIEADAEAGSNDGVGIGVSVGGQLEFGADVELVDEETIEPLDRSQVPH
ncbi:hypothetical protein BOX15_Mlig019733g1 [Macrostomum lignano]|uniref:Uncharacterized protein n=1 Tax=Macrostomum lignano TaxID=282301 RepID=A0A267F9R0_9PLAT|nr:hypothetical protein BOX15_Mlig019733g1 [Macrostomum lignano]